MRSYLSFMGFGLSWFWIMMFLAAGCHVKVSNQEPPLLEQIEPAQTDTKIMEEDCSSVKACLLNQPIRKDDEEGAAILKRTRYVFSHPSCFSKKDLDFHAESLARVTIDELTCVENMSKDRVADLSFIEAKSIFVMQADLLVSKITLELLDAYQAIDRTQAHTIVQAHVRAQAIVCSEEIASLVYSVKEAILREALVFTYRHTVQENSILDGVIGAYPYDRVNDRFQFAKDVIDRFDEEETRALPRSFLDEVGLTGEQRTELLIYLVAPNVDDDEDYADALDRRAMTYVAAGYDVTEVNAAAVEDLIESDQFADALAYAGKHFDSAHVSNTETRIMKIMRSRGCYSVMENPDGHKYSLFDFRRGCEDACEEEE